VGPGRYENPTAARCAMCIKRYDTFNSAGEQFVVALVQMVPQSTLFALFFTVGKVINMFFLME